MESAVEVVAGNMWRFVDTERGYKSVDVLIGRMGTAEPEGEGLLGSVLLWWGAPMAVAEGEGEGLGMGDMFVA